MHILQPNVSGRIKFLAIILMVAMVLIVLRLFDLQVIKHAYYKDLAMQEQVKKLVIPAERGRIYAMNGDEPIDLVMNQELYTVFVDPTVIKNPDKVEATLRRVASGNLVDKDLSSLINDKQTMYHVVARNVSLRQAEMIKRERLSGIGFQRVSKRVYPEGALAAQVLGFVNHEGKGQYGVEEALNSRLTGKDGILKSVTDIAQVPLSIGKNNIRQPAVDGDDIVLSLDRNIQAEAEAALMRGLKRTGADDGSVLVMDPNNGQVLAMANLPSYEPAKYTEVADASDFINKTVAQPFEPGSVIKTLTVAMGIDTNTIEPNSKFYNDNTERVGDVTITNARKDVTGNITMQQALDFSLNTGMVTIAKRLGDGERITRDARDTIYNYFYNKFRLGQNTGIEQAGENPGTIIKPEAVQGNAVRYSNMVFGQGMDLTMIQVASAFSALVNGGNYHSPTLVAGTYDQASGEVKAETNSKTYKNVLSPQAAAKAKQMAFEARQGYTSADNPGYYIGGKTGTSQTIENGRYIDSQTIATYIGFGGSDENSSKYVIMVRVAGKKMNLEGNIDAMPIFTDLSNWMLNYLQLSPRS